MLYASARGLKRRPSWRWRPRSTPGWSTRLRAPFTEERPVSSAQTSGSRPSLEESPSPLGGGSGWGPTKLKQTALPEIKAPLEVLAVSDQVWQRVPDRRSPAIAREPPDLALEPAECLIEAGKLPVKITPVPGIPDGGRGHVFPDRQAVECIHGLILRFRKKPRKT